MKLALFSVSYSGMWYKGPALSLREQIVKAKQMGFDGLSVETKRPVASPLDLDRKERKEIASMARSYGIELCALEANNDFSSPIPEQRENNLLMVKSIIEMAHDMDVGLVKIFAAWPGVTMRNGIATYELARKYFARQNDVTNLERWSWVVQAIKEAANVAHDCGIVLALQNHPPVVRYGYEDTLDMVKEVRAENVKLCLDVPMFENQTDEYIKQAVEKCEGLIAHSHYGSWDFRPTENGAVLQLPSQTRGKIINYRAYISELARIQYDGFLAQEECAPVLVHHQIQGIEEVDRRVAAALKYMRGLTSEFGNDQESRSLNVEPAILHNRK